MKTRIVLSCSILSLISLSTLMGDPNAQFAKANQEYAAGDFKAALEDYEELVRSGQDTPNLFYNLGNAYFRKNDFGRAILNYERALALDPHHPEAEANLRAAQASLQSARLNLGYTQVRAPVSGRIGKREITVGNLVAAGPGAPVLTTLVSVSPIYASFDADEQVIRLSMDAKATVKVGPFARGGNSRVLTKAADHDFHPQARVTPVGIFLPASDELFLYGVTSKVTSDCLVDRLIDWWEAVKDRFAKQVGAC